MPRDNQVMPDSSIALAIEEDVIDQMYEQIARMMQFDGKAQAHWMIQCVVEHFHSTRKDDEVTPGYVSGLLWELIDAEKMEIDKYGMVRVVSTAAV